MEGTCESLGTTCKQLDRMLKLGDDAGGDGVGDSDVVEEKRKECDSTIPC